MATRDIYDDGFDEDVSLPTDHGCPECGGCVRTTIRETLCERCGLVLEDGSIDRGPDWYRSDETDTGKRVGAPLTPSRHDQGLSTEIGRFRDGNGNPLSVVKQRQLRRLRRHHVHARFSTRTAQNLAYGLNEVRRLVASLELSRGLRDQSCALFRRAHRERLCVGRSLDAVAAASIYATCRCVGLPRTLEEVDSVARCSHSALTNAYRTLNTELALRIPPISISLYISAIGSELDMSERVRRRALEYGYQASEAGIANGTNPRGVAAACLYLAGRQYGLCTTQEEIAGVASVSSTTLRQRKDELLKS